MIDPLDGGMTWKVEQGDCLEILRQLPEASVDLIFGSPPYVDARLYLENGENLGIARGPEEWVAWMLEVCQVARHACKGLCAFVVEGKTSQYSYDCTPFLLMADLRRKGFVLRKPAVYRRVGIPGSGGPDWLRNDWEPIVCFTRGGRLPWSDNTACGHPPKWAPGGEMSHRISDGTRVNQWGGHERSSQQRRQDGTRQESGRPSHRFSIGSGKRANGDQKGRAEDREGYDPPAVANPGNVIDCNVGGGQMGNHLCHDNEAPFPEQLAEFFIRSFCPPGGIVCDPFSGSGTAGAVSVRWGRRFIGCDLRESQVELSRRRISQERWDWQAPPAQRKPRKEEPGPSLFDSLETPAESPEPDLFSSEE